MADRWRFTMMNTRTAPLTHVTVKIMISNTSLALDTVLSGPVYGRTAPTLGAVYHLFGYPSLALLTVLVVLIWEGYLEEGLVSVDPDRRFGAVVFLEDRVVLILHHEVAHLQSRLYFCDVLRKEMREYPVNNDLSFRVYFLNQGF